MILSPNTPDDSININNNNNNISLWYTLYGVVTDNL